MLELSVILWENERRGRHGVYLCLMFNYIAIIEPFKLQWVTIAEKSKAFG